MATKPTGRPPWRPNIPFKEDPDRFFVALILALISYQKQIFNRDMKLYEASKIVSAIQIGNEIEPSEDIVDPKTGRTAADIVAACPPGLVARAFGPRHAPRRDGSFKNTRPGVSPATIKSRANWLIDKVNRALRCQESRAWLRPVTDGLILLQDPFLSSMGAKMLRETGDPLFSEENVKAMLGSLSPK